jgi:methionine-gamma-lyase
MEPEMLQDFATRAVHAGRSDFIELGVHAPPIDLSSTYPTPDLDAAARSFDALVAGDRPQGSFVYQRLFNPTTDRFECALAELEGAEDAAAFASGMAAFTAVLLASKSRGSHVVAVRPMYGTADHLLTSGLLGLDVTWTTQDEIAAASVGLAGVSITTSAVSGRIAAAISSCVVHVTSSPSNPDVSR